MNLTHIEKYTWASVISTLVFLVIYGWLISGLKGGTENQAEKMITIYLSVIILFTISEIIIASLLLRCTKSGNIKKDERDLSIELKAYRIAYYFMFSIVNILVVLVLMSSGISRVIGAGVNITTPLLVFHTLFVLTFVTHIIKNLAQLYLYRRGA